MTVRLYRHFDANGTLLYVGISNCVFRRTAQHIRAAEWADIIRRIEIETFSTRGDAIAAEKAAIIAERPRFNKIFNKPKSPPADRPLRIDRPARPISQPASRVIEVKHQEHVLDCDEIDELDEIDDDSQLAYVWCLTHLKYESHYVPLENVRHGGIIVRRTK